MGMAGFQGQFTHPQTPSSPGPLTLMPFFLRTLQKLPGKFKNLFRKFENLTVSGVSLLDSGTCISVSFSLLSLRGLPPHARGGEGRRGVASSPATHRPPCVPRQGWGGDVSEALSP